MAFTDFLSSGYNYTNYIIIRVVQRLLFSNNSKTRYLSYNAVIVVCINYNMTATAWGSFLAYLNVCTSFLCERVLRMN